MATCRDTVKRGLQMAGVIGVTETPSADESALGLEVLQSLYDSWFESGEFGNLEDVYTATDLTAEEQKRITAPSGVTITLPATLGSGGSLRAPYLLSAVQTVIDGTVTNSIHEHSGWVSLGGLTLSSTAPLSSFGSTGLAACHSVHWCGLFGGQINPGTKLLADRFVSAFRTARNRAHRDTASVTQAYY